mgnify:CR=1 FL=1
MVRTADALWRRGLPAVVRLAQRGFRMAGRGGAGGRGAIHPQPAQGDPNTAGADLAEPACLPRHLGAARLDLGAISRPAQLWHRGGAGKLRLLLLTGLWRAAAGAALCQTAQLAGLGRHHRRDHVGDCHQIACDVNKNAASILPLAALWERVAA